MPRDNDAQRKQTKTGTNPVQQLRSEVQKIKHEDQGPVPPPQPPTAGTVHPAESPFPQGSTPVAPEEPQPESQPEPVVAEQTTAAPQTTSQEAPTPSQASKMLDEHFPASRPPMIPQGMPAAQSLLYQVVNTQRTRDQKFHLVIVPDDAHARVATFDTVEEMLTEIRRHLDTPTSLFPLMGDLMRISKGPNRYLTTPFGVLPLFALPDQDELEFESDGFVGTPTKDLEAPTAPDDDEEDYEAEMEDETPTMPSPAQQPALPVADDDDTPVLPSSAEG